jgi:hypothetical protein
MGQPTAMQTNGLLPLSRCPILYTYPKWDNNPQKQQHACCLGDDVVLKWDSLKTALKAKGLSPLCGTERGTVCSAHLLFVHRVTC